MTAEAGPYAGQDRYEARKNLVAELERLGLIVKIEDYIVPLGHCQRCDTVVEPLISKQWFVKMTPLATPAIGAVKYGLIRSCPSASTKSTWTGWRISMTGVSRANCGGGIVSPSGTATPAAR